MINILICSAIVLCFALIAFGAIFLNYEVSKEKEEAKQMNTKLQAEVSRLKEVVYNNKRLDSIYINEDKNMSGCKRTIVVNLLRKIINNMFDEYENEMITVATDDHTIKVIDKDEDEEKIITRYVYLNREDKNLYKDLLEY